jgi:hypothetical protein
MPKKTEKQKADKDVKILDVFEAWLEKQKAKPVRAKSGFVSGEE